MSRLFHTLRQAWQEFLAFRVALLYLLLLTLLVLVLPWLPLPFHPNELDLEHVFQRPFDWEAYQQGRPFHWLGTDTLGRDVLANTLFGARTAWAISFPVMVLTTLLGVGLGTSAGLYGDKKARMSRGRALMLLLAALVAFYYGIYLPLQLTSLRFDTTAYTYALTLALLLPGILVFGITPLLKRWDFFCEEIALPVDQAVLRLIEMLTSIPRLILILVLASFAPPSLLLLSLLLIFTFWTGIARLARAETLRIRELPYFEAATGIGATQAQLIYRHALPNMLAPILVSSVFGLASLMLLESTLSFLNIGVSTDLASWGRMISGIRSNTSAWWLVAFPGALLSLTVLGLQTLSHYFLKSSRGNTRL
ncbi:ABC transporter permease [Pontibacter roseus]|uniref:ABC transporter permease n=1 Tax=Pontibacter roseus TaxID=336989 RepID=UPI00035C5142|nr:ABC transporter permease [Pontibacter roseus]